MGYAREIAKRGDLTERVLAFVARSADRARARHARRRVYRMTYAELAGLSARDLSDLALSRGDIHRVAREAALAAVPK